MDEKFNHACRMALGKAIIEIGEMPEYEKYTIKDIKRCMAGIMKAYIEDINLEKCSVHKYDPDGNIIAITNDTYNPYYIKNDELKDNGHKYICALISNTCFNTSGIYMEAMRLRYLLTEHDYLSLNLVTDYTFKDKIEQYFISDSLKKATLFKEYEVKNICESLFNDNRYSYIDMYRLIQIDTNIFPMESMLNKKYVLYYLHNDTIDKKHFYVKDFITNIDIGIFYENLKDSGFKNTKFKKEAMPVSFENAILLLIALRKLYPEFKWDIEKY